MAKKRKGRVSQETPIDGVVLDQFMGSGTTGQSQRFDMLTDAKAMLLRPCAPHRYSGPRGAST
jgi:hypothetical protein